MLKLTRKVEYALIALRHIQGKDVSQISTTKEIAEQYSLPVELLAKVLQLLSKQDIIRAVQGPQGGYIPKAELKNINLIRFIEMIEGPTGLVNCNINADCLQIDNCNIRLPIKKINDNIRNIFRNITLKEITL